MPRNNDEKSLIEEYAPSLRKTNRQMRARAKIAIREATTQTTLRLSCFSVIGAPCPTVIYNEASADDGSAASSGERGVGAELEVRMDHHFRIRALPPKAGSRWTPLIPWRVVGTMSDAYAKVREILATHPINSDDEPTELEIENRTTGERVRLAMDDSRDRTYLDFPFPNEPGG